MSIESEIRDWLGYGEPVLPFMGEEFAIRDDGLIPLLRYARTTAAHPGDDDEAQQTHMGSMHRLLDDCVMDFAGLQQHGFRQKAQMSDIVGSVNFLISFYCARKHWAAMRLIGYVAENFEELDGQLIRNTGQSLARLSAREACNLALAILLDGREEEDRIVFMEDLNYEGNPGAEALAMVRQMQADKRAREEAAGG